MKPELAAAEKTYRAIGRFIFAFSQVEFTIRQRLGEAIELKEDYFTPVTESYDVAVFCKVALEVFAKQRSGKNFDRIKKEIDLFMGINNGIRTRVAHFHGGSFGVRSNQHTKCECALASADATLIWTRCL